MSALRVRRESGASKALWAIGRAAAIVMAAACFTTSAVAEEGWEMSVGVGVYGQNVYTGSNDHYISPMPSFRASFTRGGFTYFLSVLDGLGFTYVNPKYGLFGGVTMNGGEERKRESYSIIGFSVDHGEETRLLLAGSPDVSTPVSTTATLGFLTPVGLIGASLGYHPTGVSPGSSGPGEKTHHGLLYSLLYMAELPVSERVSLSGMFAVELIDDSYAEAWYSVPTPTTSLDAFHAEAGPRDLQVALQVSYRFTPRVEISVMAANTILLGDAKNSPYTVERLQRAMMIQTSYSF